MSPALDTKLRRLRLAWMAQSFEAQNTEAIRCKHSYLEYLVSGDGISERLGDGKSYAASPT